MTAGLAHAVRPGAISPTPLEDGTITLGLDGLHCHGVPSLEEFERVGTMLASAHHLLAWWIGDWYNAGDDYHGEAFAQLLDHTKLDPATVLQYARIARQVPHDRRCETLTFSHHREVADLDPPDQIRWLARAEADGFSSHRLRRELAKVMRKESRLWVLVEARSPEDADALRDHFLAEGRAAKVIER
jgi:hypothetical protein